MARHDVDQLAQKQQNYKIYIWVFRALGKYNFTYRFLSEVLLMNMALNYYYFPIKSPWYGFDENDSNFRMEMIW